MIKPSFMTTVAAMALGLCAIPATAQTGENQEQLIARGQYLARVGDCAACHTSKGGQPFAGGLAFATPIGTIYSTNITPDKTNGIGNYTEADFDQALRHGIRKDGSTLYPAMPYPSYAQVKPVDVKALYAYFTHTVKAEPTPNRDNDIAWPLSMRWPLSLWRMVFAPPPVGDDAGGDGQIGRGRYLVEGLGHCGACHTPRGFGLQEKALSDDGRLFLSGAVVDGYLANNLRGDSRDGLGKWTAQDIVSLLKSGRNGHSAVFGGMTDVVSMSTQHLSDDDLLAIANYLKSLAPANTAAVALVYDEKTHQALRSGSDKSNGAINFLNNCAACHRSSGRGYDQTFPSLALSATVNADNPASLIRIVLTGAEMPWTKSAPTQFAMPGFGTRLSDQDAAELLTFVRSSWGNNAAAVTPDMVAQVRKELAQTSAAHP